MMKQLVTFLHTMTTDYSGLAISTAYKQVKLVAFACIMLSLSVQASEQNPIILQFTNSATQTFGQADQEILKQSSVLKNLLEDTRDTQEPIELPLSSDTFTMLYTILASTTAGSTPKDPAAYQAALETVRMKLTTLNTLDLLELIRAADFLEIQPVLIESTKALTNSNHLRALVTDQQLLKQLDTLSFLDPILLPLLQQQTHTLAHKVLTKVAPVARIFKQVERPFALSKNNRFLACVAPEQTAFLTSSRASICVYDTTTAGEIARIPTDRTNLHTLSLSDDGSVLAAYQTIQGRETLTIYNVQSLGTIGIITSKEKLRFGPVLSSDSSKIAGVSRNKLLIWNITSGMLENTVALGEFIPKKITHGILIAHSQTDYQLYNVQTGQLIQQLSSIAQGPCAVSSNKQIFACAINQATIAIYDVGTGKRLFTVTTPNTQPIYTLALSADGSSLAATHQTEALTVWDTRTGAIKTSKTIAGVSSYQQSAITSNASLVALFSYNACTLVPISFEAQRIIPLGYPGALKSDLLVHSSPFACVVQTFNPLAIVFCSLQPIEQAVEAVYNLSVKQLLLMTALLTPSSTLQVPKLQTDLLNHELAQIDSSITQLIAYRYPELVSAPSAAAINQTTQEQERSVLGTLLYWIKRVVSQ